MTNHRRIFGYGGLIQIARRPFNGTGHRYVRIGRIGLEVDRWWIVRNAWMFPRVKAGPIRPVW
jgi:hypothetical protein